MFQLIVSVIAIALVAILAAASIYYGGSAFTSSTVKGNVAALINGGQQIAGANSLYFVDNTASAPTIGDLTLSNGAGHTYLAAIPQTPKFATGPWTSNGTVASIALDPTKSLAVCAEVALEAGSSAQFACVSGTTFTYNE